MTKDVKQSKSSKKDNKKQKDDKKSKDVTAAVSVPVAAPAPTTATKPVAVAEKQPQKTDKKDNKKEKKNKDKQDNSSGKKRKHEEIEETTAEVVAEDKTAEAAAPQSEKKEKKQKNKKQKTDKKPEEEKKEEHTKTVAAVAVAVAVEEEKKVDESANNKTQAKKDSKGGKKQGTESFIVEIHNLYNELKAPAIESALKEAGLPFQSVNKDGYNHATVTVSSESEIAKYLKKKTMTIQKTTVAFGRPATEEKEHIMIHGLSPELTKDQLMPYISDIATEDNVKVEQIEMFPTLLSQGRIAAYVRFSGPVPKAVQFNGAKIEGKPIEIIYVTEKDRQVSIRNLSKNMKEKTLLEYAEEAGKVDYLYIVKNDEGESTMRAVVCYKNVQSTRNVLDYNGADIEGKPVRIDLVRDEELGKKRRDNAGGNNNNSNGGNRNHQQRRRQQ